MQLKDGEYRDVRIRRLLRRELGKLLKESLEMTEYHREEERNEVSKQ